MVRMVDIESIFWKARGMFFLSWADDLRMRIVDGDE